MPSPTVPLSVENEVIAGATGAVASIVTLSAAEASSGIAGDIGRSRCEAMGAVGQCCRGVAPCTGAIGGGAAEQRGAVEHLDGAVGLRRAGQRQRIVVGEVITDRAAVGRERGNARGNRRRCVDGDAQGGRGHAGIAGGIGCRCREAVGAIGERRGGVSSRPLSRLPWRCRAAWRHRTP